MNYLDKETRKKASREAVFCVYSYLADKAPPSEGESFSAATARLQNILQKKQEKRKLSIIEGALSADPVLSLFTVGDCVISDGLNVFTFISPDGEISVVFRGTGRNEWIDNGKGLSGIPEKNTYYTYNEGGEAISSSTVTDYATAGQAEALNWFNMTAAKNGWTEGTPVTVSGHSKGGNKAQFIAIESDIADFCFSFDGQGFSPEAIDSFKEKTGESFELRREKIKSLSAFNDYINVLGDRLCKSENIFYFDAPMGDLDPVAYHFPEAILDKRGRLREEKAQGDISEYIEAVSMDIIKIPPSIRRYAVLGIVNVAAKILGAPITTDDGSLTSSETAAGLSIALSPVFSNLLGSRDGHEAISELVRIYGHGAKRRLSGLFDQIGKRLSPHSEAEAIVFACSAIDFAAPFAKAKGLPDPRPSKAVLANRLKEADRTVYIKALPIPIY